MRLVRPLLVSLILLAGARPAFADVTAFLGTATAPSNRTTRGFAIGGGLAIVGFEFEYADTIEAPLEGAPSLRTGMGNVYVQTPVAIMGLQPYLTTGGGIYRERLGTGSETHIGVNNGGGVKISLVGPVRARIDYRVFTLRGSPVESTVHRLYAGVNLKF
jgi:hypothetical protein